MPERSELAYDPSQPFLERVREAVERTRQTPSEFVEFFEDGTYREKFEFRKKDSADGIGTKGLLHWQHRTFEAAAQDAFAMVVNDLYRDGAIPYKMTDTLLIESEDGEAIGRLLEAVATQCETRGIKMGDGETAVLNTIQGFELDLTMTGAVVGQSENRYQPGDILIGLPSSGIHSNGLTDARRLFGANIPPEILTPTRVYDEVPELVSQCEVHGLTHITGGGLGKLKEGAGNVEFKIEETHLEKSSEIFHELFRRWRSETDATTADRQMHRKFNNGIGFVIGVPVETMDRAIPDILPDAQVIGEVREAAESAVLIRSAYTDRTVTL